jgi:hypothetical protein
VPLLGDLYEGKAIFLGRSDFEYLVENIWRPDLGDEVSTIGLYTSHYGQTRNIPTVRIGHIAMLPDEPVMSTRGFVKAYLVEIKSLIGLSGSPVFINVPPTRVQDGRIEMQEGRSALCIGMMLGYHLVQSVEDQIIVPRLQQSEGSGDQLDENTEYSLDERSTGFGVVLPIERLIDVMESDYMTKAMDRAIESAE